GLYLVPFNTKALLQARAIISRLASKVGCVQFHHTFNVLSRNTVDCVVGLRFDRSTAGANLARQALDRIAEEFADAGYHPYRVDNVGIARAMRHRDKNASSFGEVLRRVKYALDPVRSLSPGRYDPSSLY
ncbi:MAG: hypothetical protein J0M19_01170, partial [Sphingomonadales bacterium]|nr:hypothetical protein [Sphingomonadales bacterium]